MRLSRGRLVTAVVALIALFGLIGCATKTATPPPSTTSASAAPAFSGAKSGAASPTRPPASTKPSSADPKQQTDPESGLRFVEVSALPKEARDTLALIDKGGPFPYDKDGVTFGNFEGVLPKQARGYYKEYTVATPGSRDRGARRIVTGDNDKLFFYTDDHYQTFSRIRR